VLLVRSVILRSVFLKRFLIKVVSLPMYILIDIVVFDYIPFPVFAPILYTYSSDDPKLFNISVRFML
jgi:hypothetical protein